MTMPKPCEKFRPREPELFPKKPGVNRGPCHYHEGGTICTHREIFRCETEGFKIIPRADSDEDGEID
jgi:hypothetical protein